MVDELASKLINGQNRYCTVLTASVMTTDRKFEKEYNEVMVKWWGTWYSTRPCGERMESANKSSKRNILEALSRDPIYEVQTIAQNRLSSLKGTGKES